jgi:S-adenosylmethionine hydrolase
MAIISLTTDFGQFDGYVGVMKGVILAIAPDAQLVDLSHEIAPQDVRQAAHVLARAIPFFPEGAIHLAVVDPGVGSVRRPILVRTASAVFVGPDNGVLTPALTDATAKTWEWITEFWLRKSAPRSTAATSLRRSPAIWLAGEPRAMASRARMLSLALADRNACQTGASGAKCPCRPIR